MKFSKSILLTLALIASSAINAQNIDYSIFYLFFIFFVVNDTGQKGDDDQKTIA